METSPPEAFLPDVEEEQLATLISKTKDWQITHGMLLKYGPDVETVYAVPVGVSLFPTPFPVGLFEQVRMLQRRYNSLYMAVSENEEWLQGVLDGQIKDEGSFAATLWNIHREVKREGYIQPYTLGIFRSDYMIHDDKSPVQGTSPHLGLRQVEINTYSVAGGVHSDRVAEMHRHMHRKGAYSLAGPEMMHRRTVNEEIIPGNATTEKLVDALSQAHSLYGSPKTEQSTTPGILFVVQPRNMNICDERPLEHGLLDRSIPCFRVIFNDEVLACTYLTPTRELMYQSPSMSSALEIAVVYMRAGYELQEYTPSGYAARLLLERSRAIKCPSLLCHLATFKKVQQELAVPGVLERFLPNLEEAAAVAKTFMPMYPMDDSSTAGKKGRRLACDPITAAKHILKPSLEGGGNNIYGADIPDYLDSVPESQWQSFILMQHINSPIQKSVLLTPRGVYQEDASTKETSESHSLLSDAFSLAKPLIDRFGVPTVSELGIFGTCLWKREGNGALQVLGNAEAGWSFKTKPADVNEMSVVKGYGCFDSPILSDRYTMQ